MNNRFSLMGLGVGLCAALGVGHFASAQDNTVPSRTQRVPVSTARTTPLETLALKMSRGAGQQVVADTPLATLPVTAPTEATTPANVEAQIDAIVKEMPKGTTWIKIYLPNAPTARGYKGSDVADYAIAQAKLFGKVGEATPNGTIEVLGRVVPAEQVPTMVSTLALKPVYLIVNAAKHSLAADEAATPWNSMTAEQKQRFAANQAQQLLALDPAARGQAMQQMMDQQRQVMQSLMQNMTQQQRQEFFQQMRQNGGGGGWGGGRRGGGNGGNNGN